MPRLLTQESIIRLCSCLNVVPAASPDLPCEGLSIYRSRPLCLPLSRWLPHPIQLVVQPNDAEESGGNMENLGHPAILCLVGG